MRLCHLKNNFITPHHFLQDHCYCCLPTSMPKRPAVAVLFFFHLCYTKGNRFPLPLIKIAWFHTMSQFSTICHYLFLFCYHVFLWKTCCFSFTLSARKLPCEKKEAAPDQIQQLLFIELSFQGHNPNISDQKSWTFLVKTWKILAALLIKHPLPNQTSYLRLFISFILHCCRLQNLNKKEYIGFSCNPCILRLYDWLHHFYINNYGKNILLSYLVKHDGIIKDHQIFSL